MVDLSGFFGDAAAVSKACAYIDERMANAGIGVRFADGELPGGVIDGLNATFTLENPPNPASSLLLFKNGMKMRAGEDFVLSGSTFVYVPAQVPKGGNSPDSHEASYRY